MDVQTPAEPHIARLAFRYEHLRDLFDESIDLALKQGHVAITTLLDDALYRFQLWSSDISTTTATRDGSAQDVLHVIDSSSQDRELLLNIHEQFSKLAGILLSYLGDPAASQTRRDENDPAYKEALKNLYGVSLCFKELAQLIGRIRTEYAAALEDKAKVPRQSIVLCFGNPVVPPTQNKVF